jgi:hypothetical protein
MNTMLLPCFTIFLVITDVPGTMKIITSLTCPSDVQIDGIVVKRHAVLYSQRQLLISEIVLAQHGRN